jgi:Zn-finger nucleic acid-binding protein
MESAQDVGLVCPHCKVGLVMSDRQGIEIDYCPKCRGVWLDRGELDKIIERSLGVERSPVPQPPPLFPGLVQASPRPAGDHDERYGAGQYDRDRYRRFEHDEDHGRDDRGRRHGEKSWLERIFD